MKVKGWIRIEDLISRIVERVQYKDGPGSKGFEHLKIEEVQVGKPNYMRQSNLFR